MAGTLTISTLSDGTNSTSSTNCIQGSAKAWVNFNSTSGTSCVIRASYNVSSVTYTSGGNYTVNFTNAFADTNYALAGSAYWGGTVAGTIGIITPATSTCVIQTVRTDSMTATNMLYACASFFR